MLLLIELSRLRIESFFALPLCSYHIMGRNPCDGSRVVSNILHIPREIHCCHCDLVVKRGTNSLKVLFHVPEVFEPWHFESRWMAVVPGLKCVWSRQVRHSVHEPPTYLHSKLPNLTRSVTLWTWYNKKRISRNRKGKKTPLWYLLKRNRHAHG